MRQTRVAIGWKRLFAKSKWQTRVISKIARHCHNLKIAVEKPFAFPVKPTLPFLPYQAYLAFPTCARVKGNRAPLPVWATCASSPRSTYAYTPSEASPAHLASNRHRSARLRPFTRARLASLWEFVARREVSVSLPLPVSALPAPARRCAAQYFVGRIQPPRPAPCRDAQSPNRASPCRSARRAALFRASSS